MKMDNTAKTTDPIWDSRNSDERAFPPLNGIQAGKYKLTTMRESGKFWLENGDGEGMETSEDKIATMLANFFRREF